MRSVFNGFSAVVMCALFGCAPAPETTSAEPDASVLPGPASRFEAVLRAREATVEELEDGTLVVTEWDASSGAFRVEYTFPSVDCHGGLACDPAYVVVSLVDEGTETDAGGAYTETTVFQDGQVDVVDYAYLADGDGGTLAGLGADGREIDATWTTAADAQSWTSSTRLAGQYDASETFSLDLVANTAFDVSTVDLLATSDSPDQSTATTYAADGSAAVIWSSLDAGVASAGEDDYAADGSATGSWTSDDPTTAALPDSAGTWSSAGDGWVSATDSTLEDGSVYAETETFDGAALALDWTWDDPNTAFSPDARGHLDYTDAMNASGTSTYAGDDVDTVCVDSLIAGEWSETCSY